MEHIKMRRDLTRMQLVRQTDHVDGCGVACFAMVTGTTYREALRVLHPYADGSALTSNELLMEKLREAGLHIDVRYKVPIKQLKTSILVLRYLIGKFNYMHVAVWDAEAQAILDPWEDRPFDEYENGLCLAFELTPASV